MLYKPYNRRRFLQKAALFSNWFSHLSNFSS